MSRAPILARIGTGFLQKSALKGAAPAARVVALVAALGAFGSPAAAQDRQVILDAELIEPTTRYAHGVLGDAVEWGALRIRTSACPECGDPSETHEIRLPQSSVFEDIAARIVDADGDGLPEILVVESSLEFGARLALYTEAGLMAATPWIGRPNRWLAPVGAGDMDGDGRVELAYVDRPHLARTLRVWRLEDGALREVAEPMANVSNHRIGEDFITGGMRECGGRAEAIVATADWQELLAVRMQGSRLVARSLGAFSPQAAALALDC